MERVTVDGITLAVETIGRGEPVVFVHGALVADAFRPMLDQPTLATSYQLITYRRRGYGGSSAAAKTLSLKQQASDCAALIRRFNLDCAHVVGHSFGGAVALQLALDEPAMVHSIVLLEPALMVGASAQAYRESLEDGDKTVPDAGPSSGG